MCDNENQPLHYINNSKEENIQSNNQTIEIKNEYDVINGSIFESIITVENYPMEIIMHKKPKATKKSYTCDNCRSNTFNSKSRLKCHMKMCTGKKAENDNQILQYILNSKEEIEQSNQTNTLKHHPKTHTDNKCNICEKSFTQSSSLDQHKLIHTGEKPYKCNICEKSFTQSSSLKMHKFILIREKSYKCNYCKRSFRLKHHLMIHTRTHTGEHPFKCNFYEKSFTQSSGLNMHKLIHTREKSYKCDEYKKTFRQKITLTKHIRTHTDTYSTLKKK